MYTIEDLILKLERAPLSVVYSWDRSVASSLANQIIQGVGFTEKQGALSLRLIKRYKTYLHSVLNTDITQLIDNPTYRFPFRTINNSKRISVKDSTSHGLVFKVEFPYNDDYINCIRKARERLGKTLWDKSEKAWLFSVCEANLTFLLEFSKKESFAEDETFQLYRSQAEQIIENMEQHIPMLAIEDNLPVIKNLPSHCPPLVSKDKLAAIFEARNLGISVWDDEFVKYLDSFNQNPTMKEFLESEPGTSLHIDAKSVPIDSLTPIIKHTGAWLFVIPGGSEQAKTTMALEFLKRCSIQEDQISVMFRLPSSSGKEFNDYIKNNKLNSSLSEKTKAVFISTRLPKPILKSEINFAGVICLGIGGVHFSIRNFIDSHQNVIYYSEKTKNSESFSWLQLV